MKLQDLYDIIPEVLLIQVVDDETDMELATYDGTNSIPEKYNEQEIKWMYPLSENEIAVYI